MNQRATSTRTGVNRMKHGVIIICTLALWLAAAGCAGLRPGFESPTLNISSFRALPSEGMVPRFRIVLYVVNPNRSPLKLQGITYTVDLEGHRIITGVANDLPVIDGYGDGEIVVNAGVDLISSIQLIADLMNQPRDSFAYDLEAKMDIGGFYPRISVRETGTIALTGRAP